MLSALIAPVTGLLDKVIPDQDTKIRLAHEIAQWEKDMPKK